MTKYQLWAAVEHWSGKPVHRVHWLEKRIKELEVHFEWRGWQQREGKV